MKTSKKMEDNLKKSKNGRRPQKKWKTTSKTKQQKMEDGCDIVLN